MTRGAILDSTAWSVGCGPACVNGTQQVCMQTSEKQTVVYPLPHAHTHTHKHTIDTSPRTCGILESAKSKLGEENIWKGSAPRVPLPGPKP